MANEQRYKCDHSSTTAHTQGEKGTLCNIGI